VIEHVGDFEDQQRMAREVERIAKHYYVQTPARHFPLEPHFLFPFFAVLPFVARRELVRHFKLGWYQKIPDKKAAEEFLAGFQLRTKREMRLLFPKADIKCEKFLGLNKSYICSSFRFDA
jgi:hypothetical protein